MCVSAVRINRYMMAGRFVVGVVVVVVFLLAVALDMVVGSVYIIYKYWGRVFE